MVKGRITWDIITKSKHFLHHQLFARFRSFSVVHKTKLLSFSLEPWGSVWTRQTWIRTHAGITCSTKGNNYIDFSLLFSGIKLQPLIITHKPFKTSHLKSHCFTNTKKLSSNPFHWRCTCSYFNRHMSVVYIFSATFRSAHEYGIEYEYDFQISNQLNP